MLFIASFSTIFSQQYLDISSPGRTTASTFRDPVELYACEATPENYSVSIDNISPFTLSLCTLEYKLPTGVFYAGNFTGGGGTTIVSSTDSTVKVRFDTIASQQVITMAFDITAGCGVYELGASGGNFEVLMDAEFTQKNTGVRQYRNYTFAPLVVNYPVLQITERSYKFATIINYDLANPQIGDKIDRFITIKNGGTSPLDTVFFTSDHTNSLDFISYNLGTATGTATSHRIAFGGVDFTSIGNFDNFLDPGEQITFRETVVILNCVNLVTDYSAYWGCGTDICQTENTENRIVFPSSSPKLKITPFVDTSVCYGATASPFSRMGLTIQNFAANAIDSAKDVSIDIFQGVNGFSANFLTVIDFSSLVVFDLSTSNPVPFTVVSTTANNSALCAAAGTNSVGRFKINISKVYFGQQIVVRWNVKTCCNTVCTNDNINMYDWGYNIVYHNRCDVTYNEHVGKVGYGDRDLRHEILPGSSTSQVTSTSGLTKFEFAINNSYFNIPKQSSTDYLRYEITKPACMTFTKAVSNIYLENSAGVKISPTLANINNFGNTIEVKFESGFYNLTQGKLIVRLEPNCASCTPNETDTIAVKSYYSASSCSTCEHELGCAIIPISILCSTTCGDFKIKFGKSSFIQRAKSSYGYPDNNKDGIPDNASVGSSQPDSLRLDRASYGDAIRMNLHVEYGTNNDRNLATKKFIYYYAKIDKGANFDLDSVLFTYDAFDLSTFSGKFIADTAIPYTTIVRPIPSTDFVEFIIEINLDSLRAMNMFLTTHFYSYFQLQAFFHVNNNLGLGVTSCGVDFTAFPDVNKFTATTDIATKQSLYCNMVKSKIDLIGFDYFSHWNTYNRFTSCDTVHVTERFRFNTGTWIPGNPANNYYPNEYRNFSYPDSLKITTSNSYNLIGAKMSYTRTAGTLKTVFYPAEDIMPFLSGGVNSFAFDVKQLFRNPLVSDPSKPFIFSDEGYLCDVTLIFEPNCMNQGGLDTINYDWVLKTDSLTPTLIGCNTPPRASGQDRLEYVAPAPDLQPTIKVVRVEGRTVTWEVLVANKSNSDASNTWFGFDNPFTSLTVTKVERISAGANDMPVANSIVYGVVPQVGGIYKLNDLTGGKEFKFKITATIDPNNCDLDSLVFALSYNCDGYPTSLAAATCPFTTLSLHAQPMLPNLLNSITTSSDTISLCDTAEYVFRIENTDIGKAYDIIGNLFLQQNLNFVTGSALIYNRTTSTWNSITPTIGGFGQFVFNPLVAIPSLTDGLVGLTDTSKSYLEIKFKAVAECNFTSGSKMEIYSTANSACGYNFESPSSFSNGLHITGATPSHTNQVILTSGFLSPCYDSTLVNLKVVNKGPINSWVGDSVTLVLPRGIHYANGTYSALQNAGITAPSISNYAGKEYLTWSLQNLNAFTDTSEFSVEIYSIPDSVKSCDANYLYAYTTTQDSVVCVSTGTNCAVKIISGDTTEAIFTYKATNSLSNATAYSIPNAPSGEKVILSFDINNQGQTIKKFINGDSIATVLSIYRDVDNSGTLSFSDVFVMNKTSYIDVPQGISTYYDTIDIPAGDACNFIAVIDFDENSCVCNTAEIFVTPIPLVYNEPNDTVCEEESTIIGYENPITGYTYSWTAGSNANLSYLDFANIPSPIFTSPSINKAIDTMEYFITIERMGCISYDTINVFVYNTPQAFAGNDTTVCYDSTRLNGNVPPVLLSGSGTLKSHWEIDSTYGNGFTGVVIQDSSQYNSLVNGLYNGQYRFIWVFDNGQCNPTRDTVEITVINPVFNAGNDTILCSTSDYELTAKVTSPGFNLLWTILPSSPSGSVLSNSTIEKPFLQNIQEGIYSLELSITTGSCIFKDTVIIDVNAIPTVNAGSDSITCGISTINLWADTILSRGVSLWTVDSTLGNASSVSITNLNGRNTSASFAKPGTYGLIWNSVHPVCGTVSDTVQIIITSPITSDAGKDSILCSTTSIVLYGNPVDTLETGTWSQIAGPSFVVFSNSSVYNSSASNLVYGTYELVWEVENGFCDSVTDTIVIFVDSMPSSNAGFDETICISETGAYNLKAGALLATNNGIWHQLSGTNVTFTNASSPTSGVMSLQPGVYTFEWNVTNNNCDTTRDIMNLEVLPTPIVNAGNDTSLCSAISFNLSANNLLFNEIGTWSVFSGPNTPLFTNATSPSSSVTGLVWPGTYKLLWTVNNLSCAPVTDTIIITNFPEAIAFAGLNDTICIEDSASYTLGALPILPTDSGNWIQLSGLPVKFVSPNSNTSSITGLVAGSYEFIWNVTNGVCDTVKDTMQLVVYPEAIAEAGNDTIICVDSVSGFALSADPIAIGETGFWSQLYSNTVVFNDATSPTSVISGMTSGTYTFVWSVSNGVCTATEDTIVVIVSPLPVINAGNDMNLCSPVPVNLGASALQTGETGTWTSLASNPFPTVFSNDTLSNSMVSTNSNYGTYHFVWTVQNQYCGSVSDTVQLTIDSISVPFAGADTNVCGANTITLNADPVTSPIDSGTWTQIDLNTAVNFSNVNDPKAVVSGLVPNDYVFVWTVGNYVCPSVYDTVRISVYEPSIADAGKDERFCEITSTALLNGGGHIKPYHTYSWSYNAAGSNTTSIPVIVSPNTQSTAINNLGVGIYSFVLEVNNSVCNASYDTMMIEVYANPIADFTIDNQAACLGDCSDFTNQSVVLDPSGSVLVGYAWDFGDESTSNATHPTNCYAAVDSYSVSLIAVSDKGCLDTVMKTNYVSINPLPIAGFDLSSQVVGPGDQVILTDVSIGAVSYVYDLGNGFSTDREPLYNYYDTGVYDVTQWVINAFGCRDSITKSIKVEDKVNIFVPNAFTPNNDGDNDDFRPVFLSVDDKRYSFMVFNRWGELIYQTTEVLDAWDGRHNGEPVPNGVYVYRVTYKEKNGFGVFTKEGQVTVIR